MAELNKIRFLFFVLLMIFPARALDVILSDAHQDFKQKSEINIDFMDGEKIYRGTSNELSYEVRKGTYKVIVYITSKSRCIEILTPAVSELRSQIGRELRESHCDLVFLGIEHFDDDEYHIIGAFILEKIQPHPDHSVYPNLPEFKIKTIGENRFDQFYRCHFVDFEKYAHISRGTLLARLRSIPHGALRPVGRNGKEIKLYGYYPFAGETRWPFSVRNNTYVPDVDSSDPKFNFMMGYPDKKICLLILSGKDYSDVTSYGNRRSQRSAMKRILDRMKKNDEALIILGFFNFDWTEIDIVTQFILKLSEGLQSSDYNVFTHGYGMFNTYYRNVFEDDGRDIRQQPNSYVSEVIRKLVGREVKKRAINVYHFDDNKWKLWNTSINLSNGRYVPEDEHKHFTLPCQYQKTAFIVYDRAEVNHPIDYAILDQPLEELKRSSIAVVLIEASNFGLDDMHIIAEWIDRHSGVNDSEQIAVLGGGLFDTIFQSESTTYNRFLNTKKNELETIRNIYVRSGNGKSVSVAEIDQFSDYKAWSYPMNTIVNGFYEADLIPDKKMFNTTDEKKVYFIITNAYHIHQISKMDNLDELILLFRKAINPYYPNWKWSVFLAGFDNFCERDSHLFAELVRRQTKDGRFLHKFVRTNSNSQAIYQYKDTEPLDVDSPNSFIRERFEFFFGLHM